jgi:hypothetical protein
VNPDQRGKWMGTTRYFLTIEIVVFISYLITMPLLLLKSRCIKVGVDSSQQFNDTYMGWMASALVKQLVLKYKNKLEDPEYFINKVRNLRFQGIKIKVKLSEDDFFNIIEKLEEGERDKFVEKEEGSGWIERCIVGRITKSNLQK